MQSAGVPQSPTGGAGGTPSGGVVIMSSPTQPSAPVPVSTGSGQYIVGTLQFAMGPELGVNN